MSKIWFAISLVGLLACGTGESDSGATGSIPDTPAVSAKAPTGNSAGAPAAQKMEAAAGEQAEAAPAEVTSCLRLVAAKKFEDALPVCIEAASLDAENAQVKAALATAKAETAKEAATGAAGDAAANALGGLGD